jgi:hypothetical protein
VRGWLLALIGVLAAAPSLRATNDQTIVINEVGVVPGSGGEKFVEILNRGAVVLDTTNWWICDHPQALYRRLLQVPQYTGPPLAPGILVAPGDFLVFRLHAMVFPAPNGDYATRPNSAGTTTHIVRLFLPAGAIPFFLRSDNGNFSIWDHSPPSDPDFPYFDSAQFMRDFVAWGPGGIHTGLQRGCVASQPVAALWPGPLSGDCITGTPTPTFAAADSSLFPPGSWLSVNYNGRTANDPSDYFIAPSTEGEPNVMPGDMDGDFDMDTADYDAFVACLGQSASVLPCRPGDLDHSGTVDCADWPIFVNSWQQYTSEPVPPTPPPCMPCMRGDVNGDKLVNGDDIGGFLAVATGGDTDPQHRCAADADGNGQIADADVDAFVSLLLGNIR